MDTVDMNQTAEPLVERVARYLFDCAYLQPWDDVDAENNLRREYRARAQIVVDMCKAEGANLWTRGELIRMSMEKLEGFDLHIIPRPDDESGNMVVIESLQAIKDHYDETAASITVPAETVEEIDGVLMEAKPQRLHKKDRRTLGRIDYHVHETLLHGGRISESIDALRSAVDRVIHDQNRQSEIQTGRHDVLYDGIYAITSHLESIDARLTAIEETQTERYDFLVQCLAALTRYATDTNGTLTAIMDGLTEPDEKQKDDDDEPKPEDFRVLVNGSMQPGEYAVIKRPFGFELDENGNWKYLVK